MRWRSYDAHAHAGAAGPQAGGRHPRPMTASALTTGRDNGSGPASFAPGNDAGPLAVLHRIRLPSPPPPWASAARCAPVDPLRATHVVDVGQRTLVCACRPATSCSPPRRRGGRYRAVPERYLPVTDFALTPAQWDSLQIPVAVAFFFATRVGHGRLLPEPGRRHRVPAAASAWAEVEVANPVVGDPPARRRGRLDPHRRRRGRHRRGVLRRSHRRLLRAGGPPATGCGGASTGGARPTRPWPLLRPPPGPGTRRQGGLVADLASDVTGVEVEPNAAVPTLILVPAAETSPGSDPRHRPADPDAHRAAAPPLQPGRAGAAVGTVRRAAAVGRDAAAVPVDPRGDHGQPGSRARRLVAAHGVHVRLRGGGIEVPARSGRRSRCRCCSCSAAPCSPRATRGFAAELVPWHLECEYRLPVTLWREVMDRYFPGRRLAAPRPGDHRPPAALPGRTGPAHMGAGHRGLAQRSGGGRMSAAETIWWRGPQPTSTIASPRPRVADAVCTRATCCTPTGHRPRRTSCAGSSACSVPRRRPRRRTVRRKAQFVVEGPDRGPV